jgi:hypothetical protein
LEDDLYSSALLSFWGSRVRESLEQRNANDGLRLAAILLDTKHRSTVRQIMTNLKQDRKQQDQATCPIHAFYSVVSQDFTSPLYVILVVVATARPSRDGRLQRQHSNPFRNGKITYKLSWRRLLGT